MSDDAKKFAVKEKFKARPGLGRIMPEKGNELVPVAQHTRTTIEELPSRTKTVKTKTEQRTVVAPATPVAQDNTQVTQYGTFAQERVHGERTVKRAPKRADRTPWVFLVPAIALVAFIWFDESSNQSAQSSPFAQRQSGTDDRALAERADMHRKMTGWKMNRERADVQIQNHFTAPNLPLGASRQKAPDIMAGLPLVGEAHPNADPDVNRGISADHPDTKIMYGLQEEQDRQIFDQMVEERFVKDFIENARREGYELEVMNDGTVKIKRAPSQVRDAGDPSTSY